MGTRFNVDEFWFGCCESVSFVGFGYVILEAGLHTMLILGLVICGFLIWVCNRLGLGRICNLGFLVLSSCWAWLELILWLGICGFLVWVYNGLDLGRICNLGFLVLGCWAWLELMS